MSAPLDRDDARLARLLASVRADAPPASLARARARLAARAAGASFAPPALAWRFRPAALAAAAAAGVVALAAGGLWSGGAATSSRGSLVASLASGGGSIADDLLGESGEPASDAAPHGAARDSGGPS